MKTFLAEIRTSLLLTIVLLVAVSGLYPLAIWAGGRVLFPRQADGSLLRDAGGHVIGSALLAPNFTGAGYFHPRPSAAGNGYDDTNSGGTNYGPTSAKLAHDIGDLVAAYRKDNGLRPGDAVPADAVTRSGSGLDPDISVRNADIQAARVARARRLPLAEVEALVAAHTASRDLTVLGEPRVNVLLLNLALGKDNAK